jgi:hypothetical protein
MNNGLYNGLDSGLNQGRFSGLDNGLALGLFGNVRAKLDKDVIPYIENAKIMRAQEIFAINYLVTNTKKFFLWDKIKAIYPFLGDTLLSNAFNLKIPIDSNSAYRLNFNNNSPLITRFGVEFIGSDSSSWATTNLIPSQVLIKGNLALGCYINGGNLGGSPYPVTMGSSTTSNTNTDVTNLTIRTTNKYFVPNGDAQPFVSSSDTTITGNYIGTALNGLANLYRNGIELGNTATSTNGGISGSPIFIGALGQNINSTYQNVRLGICFISTGLTKIDVRNFDMIIQNYVSILNRR